jgi:hypothetical protein
MAEARKIVGISMIRNDADIVEPFVRHALRVLDHLFVIVHCPQDGTDEMRAAIEEALAPLPPDAVAARIRLRTFVTTSEDPADEPNPLRRIRYAPGITATGGGQRP